MGALGQAPPLAALGRLEVLAQRTTFCLREVNRSTAIDMEGEA
jgi:hypothetical protein